MEKVMQSLVKIGVIDPTPLGPVWVGVREKKLVAVAIGRVREQMEGMLRDLLPECEIVYDAEKVRPFLSQIETYLTGERKSFEMPIDWNVLTPFQADTLRLVHRIPYGETRSYGEVARTLGKPKSARAVGVANAKNPMPIVIPCHRVVGSDGKLRGYSAASGVDSKEWLLHLEGVIQARQMKLF